MESDSIIGAQIAVMKVFSSAEQSLRRAVAVHARWLPYAVAFLLLSATRLVGLTHQSLWFDEAYTLQLASAPTFHTFIKTFADMTASEHLQPLYYFIMFGWSRLMGTSDTALRLPSALFSIGSGVYAFALLRQLSFQRNKAYALVGAALFSMSSYSIYYAQEARPYACVQCLSFAVLYAWLTLTRGSAIRRASGVQKSDRLHLVLACVLAALSSIFGLLLVVSLCIADRVGQGQDTRRWWRTWRASALALLLTSVAYGLFAKICFPVIQTNFVSIKQPLWMNTAYTMFGMMFGTTIGPNSLTLRSTSRMAAMLHAWPVLLSAAVVIAVCICGVSLFVRQAPQGSLARIACLASTLYAAVLFVGFGYLGHLNVLPRHGSALFALAVFTVAVCLLESSGRTKPPATRMIVMAALGLAIVLNCISAVYGMQEQQFRKDDYRAVAASLSSFHTAPVYLSSGSPYLLQHYGLETVSAVDVPPTQLAAELLHARAPRVVVVNNEFRNYRWDDAPSLTQVLSPEYACQTEGTYAYFEVLSCTPRQVDAFDLAGMIHAR